MLSSIKEYTLSREVTLTQFQWIVIVEIAIAAYVINENLRRLLSFTREIKEMLDKADLVSKLDLIEMNTERIHLNTWENTREGARSMSELD